MMTVATLLNGCVLPENKIEIQENIIVNDEGKKEKINIPYGHKGYEYTFVGNIWNSATYGVLGAGYGAVEGWKHGFNTTNDSSIASRVFDGTMDAFSGSFECAKDAMVYGYNMTYDKDLSVERMLKETIDETVPKFIPFYKENER